MRCLNAGMGASLTRIREVFSRELLAWRVPALVAIESLGALVAPQTRTQSDSAFRPGENYSCSQGSSIHAGVCPREQRERKVYFNGKPVESIAHLLFRLTL